MIHWCVWDATSPWPTSEMMQNRWTEQGRRLSYPYWNHGQPFKVLCNKLCGSWVLAIQLRLSSCFYPLSHLSSPELEYTWLGCIWRLCGWWIRESAKWETVRDKEDLNQHKRIGNRMRGGPGSQKVQRCSHEIGRRIQHSRILSSYSKGTLTVCSTLSSSPT